MKDKLDEKFGRGVAFERIRRLTGYLSKLTMWNDAKLAELEDRVKHGLGTESK